MEAFKAFVKAFCEGQEADLFIYSGDITRENVRDFMICVDASRQYDKVAIIMTTYGGDPHAAYTLARSIRRIYSDFTLYVLGMCKSAGTLIALGANSIVMAPMGELGPLDIQIPKHDQLFGQSSGMDIDESIKALSREAYDIFEHNFLRIESSGQGAGSITTHMAAEIASTLAIGVISPISKQIDPMRLGECERKMTISEKYGKSLNANHILVDTLVRSYPDHSYVIDIEEAKTLFRNVRDLDENVDGDLYSMLLTLEASTGRGQFVALPSKTFLCGNLHPEQEESAYEQQENRNANDNDSGHEGAEGGNQHRAEPAVPTGNSDGDTGDEAAYASAIGTGVTA